MHYTKHEDENKKITSKCYRKFRNKAEADFSMFFKAERQGGTRV